MVCVSFFVQTVVFPWSGVYPSIVRLSFTMPNIFSEIAGPIKVKFYVKPLVGGTLHAGHMTKMAAMPIYGKNTYISSPEPMV